MSQIQLLRNSAETSFSKPIKRSLFRDTRLSYGARGLFGMLWDFPENWVFYSSFIVGMSPGGMTQLQTYIKELKQFNAITINPKRLSAEEAKQMSTPEGKNYRAGQIVGKQWTLNSPDLWAVEAPLKKIRQEEQPCPPIHRFPNSRKIQPSENPAHSKSEAKVLQLEDSANISPLPLPTSEKPTVSSSGNNYIYPKQLSKQEQELAKCYLDGIEPELAQKLLDELAARLNSNSIRSSALGYLRSLITRAKSRQFTPEAGIRVAVARQNALKEKINKSSHTANPTNPNDVPKRLAAMHQVLGRKDK